MSKLAEKIRKSRESDVEVGGYTFTVRRPTDIDMLEFRAGMTPRSLMRFIVGWKGVKDSDLYPGGDPHPAEFDLEACAEWVADNAEIFSKLVTSILEAYAAHQKRTEEAKKN